MKKYTIESEDDYLVFFEGLSQGILDRIPDSGQCEPHIKDELENMNLELDLKWAREFHESFGLDEELNEQELKEFVLWTAVNDNKER